MRAHNMRDILSRRMPKWGLVFKLRERLKHVHNKVAERYEDGELTVQAAVDDKTLEDMILEALETAGEPVRWKELKLAFSGIAGEDRLRRAVTRLKATSKVAELSGTRIALPKHVSPEMVGKVRNKPVIAEILKRAEAGGNVG